MSTTLELTPVTLIAAMAQNRVIGHLNQLPWQLPADLKRFKALTMGHRIVMGRNTFESIGRPLPGRENIVVSRTLQRREGITIVGDLETALRLPSTENQSVFIIGGGQLYAHALANFAPQINCMELTIIDHPFAGDAWFPNYDEDDWICEASEKHVHSAEDGNSFTYEFCTLTRRSVA